MTHAPSSGIQALLAIALLAGWSCRERSASDDSAYAHVLDFDSATVRLATTRDTVPLALQLATATDQKRLGLMERRHLSDRAGMLFVYDSVQPPDAGFWMYRTRIPLDIAFLDSAGVVQSIRAMVPCPTTMPQGCPAYEPGTPYRYALEVNGGALKRWGVEAGSRLLVDDLPVRQVDKRAGSPAGKARLGAPPVDR
jgi:uncharacterized membrane protein (UPF0127 family)